MDWLFDFFRYSFVVDLYKKYKLNKLKRKWHRINLHNKTVPENIFDISKVEIGVETYGRLNIVNFGDKHHLKIGSYVSMADGITFILDAEHLTSHISTYPFKVNITKEETSEAIGKGDIIVEDDVWIGYGATIMSGVHIGQGAVIAAGAVVTKDIPPYAIVGGVPAKVIKYRFEPELIEELLKVDYSKLTKEEIEKHIDELYVELKDKRQLDWMPKRTCEW